ncbi:hypothetical protein P5673_016354 [Acropora cervicornis]|uniref:Uncharacterized protein n=1 Tax=Acropora cervicornis TaxID=6130 RepID=A0AAD9QG16_ACRCE|nr:hypothetical protein P5673_016354 [Acropora cervicornis]
MYTDEDSHVKIATHWQAREGDYIANLCKKTFSSIANHTAHRLYSMLPFSGPSRYNLRLKGRVVLEVGGYKMPEEDVGEPEKNRNHPLYFLMAPYN